VGGEKTKGGLRTGSRRGGGESGLNTGGGWVGGEGTGGGLRTGGGRGGGESEGGGVTIRSEGREVGRDGKNKVVGGEEKLLWVVGGELVSERGDADDDMSTPEGQPPPSEMGVPRSEVGVLKSEVGVLSSESRVLTSKAGVLSSDARVLSSKAEEVPSPQTVVQLLPVPSHILARMRAHRRRNGPVTGGP